MDVEIKKIENCDEKSLICNDILRSLPDWFANEASIVDYVNEVRDMPFFVAFSRGKAVGFIAVKDHNEYTAEVYVMGILPEYHRLGIGRHLIESCEIYCFTSGKVFLTVKTLDSSAHYEPYERTRNFYLNMGFLPLEIFPLHWDKDNPCLLLAKHIAKRTD